MAPGSGQEPDAEDRALLDAGLTQFDLDELRTEFFLPNTTIQHYINSFRKYDKDGSGDIDLDELSQLLHDVGIKLPEADVDDMMSIVDTDGGGTVGLSEFIYLMADPDGPLAKAINGQDGLVDPRQARLKRGYKEVQRKRRDLFASRRVRLQGRLRCRNPGFPADSNVGRRGWAGCVGVGAVSCSEELPDIVPKARFARSHVRFKDSWCYRASTTSSVLTPPRYTAGRPVGRGGRWGRSCCNLSATPNMGAC
jgi:hypothetical protein